MVRHLWPDLRSGVRMLLRHPTLSAAAILTFGLGMGLATAVFNVANGVLFHGLPFEDGGRIVLVAGADSARGPDLGGVAVHDYVELGAGHGHPHAHRHQSARRASRGPARQEPRPGGGPGKGVEASVGRA